MSLSGQPPGLSTLNSMPTPTSIPPSQFSGREHLERVREELNFLENYYASSQMKLEQLNVEKQDLQRQYLACYEMAYQMTMEVHKLTDINNRLHSIINRYVPMLSSDAQTKFRRDLEIMKTEVEKRVPPGLNFPVQQIPPQARPGYQQEIGGPYGAGMNGPMSASTGGGAVGGAQGAGGSSHVSSTSSSVGGGSGSGSSGGPPIITGPLQGPLPVVAPSPSIGNPPHPPSSHPSLQVMHSSSHFPFVQAQPYAQSGPSTSSLASSPSTPNSRAKTTPKPGRPPKDRSGPKTKKVKTEKTEKADTDPNTEEKSDDELHIATEEEAKKHPEVKSEPSRPSVQNFNPSLEALAQVASNAASKVTSSHQSVQHRSGLANSQISSSALTALPTVKQLSSEQATNIDDPSAHQPIENGRESKSIVSASPSQQPSPPSSHPSLPPLSSLPSLSSLPPSSSSSSSTLPAVHLPVAPVPYGSTSSPPSSSHSSLPSGSIQTTPEGAAAELDDQDKEKEEGPAPRDARLLMQLPHGEVVCAVALSNPFRFVYTGGKGCVKIWDTTKKEKPFITELPCLKEQYIRSCKLSPDSSTMVVGGETNVLAVWDLKSNPPSLKTELSIGAEAVYAIAISNDSRYCFSCCSDGKIYMWDLTTFKLIRTLEGHDDGASCLDLSPDGKNLFTGGLDNTVRVWEVSSGKELAQYVYSSQIFALGISPTLPFLAVGLENNQVEISNLLHPKRKHELLQRHESCVLSLKFASSGKWFLTTGKDKMLVAWKCPQFESIFQKVEGTSILCCDISMDGHFLVTGSGDKVASLYEIVY